MFGASVKISSGLYKKMVNFKPLSKNFWTRKQRTKKLSPPENPPVAGCGESPSKCRDPHFGKPLPRPKKSLLNFCRGKSAIKQKPSNCDEKECEKRETFLEYLFGKKWKTPEKSLPRVKYTLCCELSSPKFQELLEPQPRPPPEFPPPKAVNTRKFVEKSQKIPFDCSAAELFAHQFSHDSTQGHKIQAFRIPFEEMRPPPNIKEKFTCHSGIDYDNVLTPMKRNNSVESIKVERISKFAGEIPKPPSTKFNAEGSCDFHPKNVTRTSRVEKLKALVTSAKYCPLPNFKTSK